MIKIANTGERLALKIANCSNCLALVRTKDRKKEYCSRCKAVFYCSLTCERAHLPGHQSQCGSEIQLWKHILTSDSSFGHRFLPPDDLDWKELQRQLMSWKEAHMDLFYWATYQALFRPDDRGRIFSHFLCIKPQHRSDHEGSVRKYFRITDASIQHFTEAERHWPSVATAFTFRCHMREDIAEASGQRIITALLLVDCRPWYAWFQPVELAMEMFVPGLLWTNWKDVLMGDVEDGVPYSQFVERHCSPTIKS